MLSPLPDELNHTSLASFGWSMDLTRPPLGSLSGLLLAILVAMGLMDGSCFLWRAQSHSVAGFRQHVVNTHRCLSTRYRCFDLSTCRWWSKLHSYDDVGERVAQHLGLEDPSKIRLTSHNCYSQQPKPQPIKYRGVEHLSDMLVQYSQTPDILYYELLDIPGGVVRLSDMLVHYNQTYDILYYEVLDIPLPESQCLKTLKVSFHHATKDEVVIHTIRLPKQSTVVDVINDLKTKVELSHPNAEL